MANPKTSKKPSTALAKWDERLAELVRRSTKTESSVATGSFISLKGGIMSYQGNQVPDNALRCVIVDAVMENSLFVGKFDPNTPQSPVCYAFGRDDDEMQPHEKAPEPQCESCTACEFNEWGSGDGRGKACKNVRRLALIPEDALDNGAEGISGADFAFLKLPVTSVKAWAGYVNQLATLGKPSLAFVTEITVVPDGTSQFKVQFKAVEEIDDGELLEALLDKLDAAEQAIVFPYQEVTQQPEKPARKAKPAARPAARPAAKPAACPAARPAAKPAAPGRRKF